MKLIRFMLSRGFMFYGVCFVVLWLMLDKKALMGNAIAQTMSRLTPPMNYFAEFDTPGVVYNRFRLKDCIYYHERVVDYFGFQKAEALAMEGYCYARSGDGRKAQEKLLNSIHENPNYFWPYYNLGVLAYRNKNDQNAFEYMNKALAQDPRRVLYMMSQSKVFMDVCLSDVKARCDFGSRLKEGRRLAYGVMAEIFLKNKDYQRAMAVVMQAKSEGFMDIHADQLDIKFF